MKSSIRAHIVSAILGGLAVGGVLIVSGVTGTRRTQTIVEEAPVAQTGANPSSGLTPHDIYQRDAPGVVFVRARLIEQIPSPFNLFHSRPSDTSTGSGFVVDRRGDILTTYHVIAGADRSGGGVTVEFEGAAVRGATVVAVDPDDDLAVLHVDMRGVPPVSPLVLGDSTSVRVGDPTLAIGNPFGLDRTLTSGIVSALQHQIQAANGLSIDNVIQTDQPIQAGNSGGPLLDAGGRVIGVNSQITTAGGGTEAGLQVAFAVPIDTANGILARVDRGRPVRLAYIGLGGGRAVAARGGRPGVTVGSIAAGGPAAVAGVRRGDRLELVGGVPVASISDVLAIVSTRSPGQILSLELRRDRQVRTVTVVLGSRTAPMPAR